MLRMRKTVRAPVAGPLEPVYIGGPLEPRRGASVVVDLLREYLPILMFFAVAVGLAMAMIVASLIVGRQRPDPEKLSAYECGFEAFDDARRQFDVRFYLVAILFIIFDLEVAFLFPWAISLGEIGVFGFWSMMVFLGVLTVGFIYEWKKGALEWE
jgi:NADH-quinone oxidoreductase subunit A